MQLSFSCFLAAALALVPLSSAAPAPAGTIALTKRQIGNLFPSDKFAACPNYRYSAPQAEAAAQEGVHRVPLANRINGYSHIFGNNRKIKFDPACYDLVLYEFPILPGGNIYSGGDPKADRVVFALSGQDPANNGRFCGIMTHDGAPEGEFNLCPIED
ncbi:hypothetical protein ANO11243_061680 [Dothideomycetidae sp. 11243]|nr:hypothetical protein ANO11243_061680 [fungal sp. No.11243]